MSKLLQGDALTKKAEKLGCDTTGDLITHSSAGRSARASDAELQRRVMEAERSKRESWLWVVALISSIASVFSALAAWYAVWK